MCKAGISHDLLDRNPGITIAVEKAPGAFEDFLARIALVPRWIGHGFVLNGMTIIPPKDDLEHLFRRVLRGHHLVVRHRPAGSFYDART
jgi:hypothetical protein